MLRAPLSERFTLFEKGCRVRGKGRGQEQPSRAVWAISKVCLGEGNFGAIYEWASAPPAIAFVTKSPGVLTSFLSA
jgi:hypothetical protein